MPNYYNTPGGILYEELNGYPKPSATRSEFTLTTQWKINGSDLWNLFDECFPEPVFGGGTIHATPMSYPGRSWLYCQSVSIDPLGGEDLPAAFNSVKGYNTYDYLVATLQFGTMSWEKETDPQTQDETLRTVNVSFGGEYLNLQQYNLFWQVAMPGANEIAEGDIEIGKMIPTIEYDVQMHHYAYLPLATIIDNLGKVNSAANQVIGHEAVETLLFVGATANRTVTWKGTGTWQLGFRFSEKQTKSGTNSYGWNHFWKPSDSQWQKVVDEKNDLIFPMADLSKLFKAKT